MKKSNSDQSSNLRKSEVARSVRVWLFVGVVLIFFQIVLGGITRLTDSGLSITEWAVIQGTLPPLNTAEWTVAFDKYKLAANKQYRTLHAGMTLSEFKVIFLWEYFHRLWARMMGFIFLFPALYFAYKRMLPLWLLKRLGIVILLAILAATFGWIMVASGLNDDTRTWVSAYKLVTHLSIATVLFAYLFWTWLKASQPIAHDSHFKNLRRSARLIIGILLLQIVLGGLMAGMRAGLIHPHFPYFIKGKSFFQALFNSSADSASIINYEPALGIKAWVQLFHRGVAYLLVIIILQFFFKAKKLFISKQLSIGIHVLLFILIVQFTLGALTIVNSIGRIPIALGVFHQAVALILLLVILFINYQFTGDEN